MKIESVISFFVAMIINAVAIGTVLFVFLLFNFDLGGGKTLTQSDSQNIMQVVILIVLSAISIFIARSYIKKNKKAIGYGIISFSLLAILTGIFYLWDQNFNHTSFEKNIWEKSRWKPERMAKSLVRSKTLIGLTRKQVKEKLGDGSEEYGNANSELRSIIYLVQEHWTLTILFKNDTVTEANLRLPYLGI